MGIPSKKTALKAFQELETLRNNLARSRQIIPESWERIVTRFAFSSTMCKSRLRSARYRQRRKAIATT